jgi:hypothetical protein
MAELTADYRAESKTMRDRYGETAEVPRTPIGATAGMLKGQQPIAARIATLAQQVTSAADLLDEARVRHRTAGEHRAKCEAQFAQAREELVRAMNEHGEGTPENVPYQP